LPPTSVLTSSHLSSLPPAVHFCLPSGLCYSQPIDCTVCNQVQVQAITGDPQFATVSRVDLAAIRASLDDTMTRTLDEALGRAAASALHPAAPPPPRRTSCSVPLPGSQATAQRTRRRHARTFPFASCRGGAAPRPVPGRLHAHHHRLRHSLLGLRAAGQLARTATRFTPHIAAIPCCSHLRFDDPVSPPAPATITTLCSVHLRHAQPCKPRKSPWSTPSDSSLHRQQRAFGALLPSSTRLLLRQPLQIRHQKTRLGACQPVRSLPAAFGGQLLQGSVCN